jgi:helicase MOV-10
MERLMHRPIYQKDPETGTYNPLLITKLVRSFRSHSKIIEFANNKFYDGDLQASGPLDTINCALNWEKLPNPSVPVIFVPCYGESKKDEGSYSSYNLREIDIIVEYVRAILLNGINGREIHQQDVGIISPYKRQVQKIRSELEKIEMDGIEAGTVENFQGREKLVIIISTVRSRTPTVGFLDNPKRLNVTITRAKALQIIIGNPTTLKTDPYWFDLLDWCLKNRCCTTQVQLGQGRRLQQFKNRPEKCATEEGQLWDELDGDNVMADDFF